MSNNVYKVLQNRIVNVQYKPGEPLTENKLTKQFRVSRTPIREALIRLSEENLVTIIPNSGARVTDINLLDFQKFISLRLILERGVSELAVQSITEEEIQDLERLNEKIHITHSGDLSKMIDHDMEFHYIIRKASHNQILDKYLLNIQNQFFRIQRFLSIKPDLMPIDLPKVIQALQQKDADEMKRLMVEHVEHFVEKVRSYF